MYKSIVFVFVWMICVSVLSALPNIILTGKFTQILPTLWESKWSIYSDEEVVSWISQSEIPDIVLEEGIDELVDRLVVRYANVGQQGTRTIEILVNDCLLYTSPSPRDS